jgi:hypothetical protein
VPSDLPEGVEYHFTEVRLTDDGGSLQSRGPEAPLGLRTFLPVFGMTRLCIEVAGALGLIQDAVQRIAGPWPETNAYAKARSDGEGVLAWFQNDAGDHLIPDIRITPDVVEDR